MGARDREGRFAGRRGVEIYWQCWLPDGAARSIVLIAHGAAEHGGRYGWTGEQLAARGHAVYTLDHRGHGRSRGSRAYVDRLRPPLTIGTELIVDGYQTKDHSLKRANGRDVTFTDGRKMFMGSSGTGAPRDGRDPIEGGAKKPPPPRR